MNRNHRNPDSTDYSVSNFTESVTLPKVAALVVLIVLFLSLVPVLIRAEESGSAGTGTDATSDETDLSGSEGENAVELSGGETENSGLLQNLVDQPLPGTDTPESDLSGYEGEPEISAGETESGVTREEYEIPEAMGKDYAEFYDISPSETERNIFKIRPWDPFYEKVISEAPAPDIKMLGPLPEVIEEGVNFTDVAADWIYSRKSAGLTDLRGHVMIVYETTIISCDEA
ncbi:MAG: hypothetical protein ABIC40_04970, partial [bacterium]